LPVALALGLAWGCVAPRPPAGIPPARAPEPPVLGAGGAAPDARSADGDHDGIPDRDDGCPDEAEDSDGFEDADGCPDPDNDHDRILDRQDRCPDVAETYNGVDDEDGCPEVPPPPLSPLSGQSAPAAPPAPPGLEERFAELLREFKDLEYPGLVKKLGVAKAPDRLTPPFDVGAAKYFDQVTTALEMTEDERDRLRKAGMVSLDHRQRYSMASAYFAIYTRDLPVLVTTDSILHALHRSYDQILIELETRAFTQTLAELLSAVSARLIEAREAAELPASLQVGLRDVDLYITVARNLLAGAAALSDEPPPAAPRSAGGTSGHGGPARRPPVASALGQDIEVGALLDKIASLRLETPDGGATTMRGAERYIDFSQFKPRGHYTRSAELRRYFRAMMWLGRPDLGFILKPSPGESADAEREGRAAALLGQLIRSTGLAGRLRWMSRIIDVLIGATDDVPFEAVEDALAATGLAENGPLAALADARRLEAVRNSLAKASSGRGQIRGQVSTSPRQGTQSPPPAVTVQLFGQRFGLDSYLLSKVVFDSITFQGVKQGRWMPSGLDAMAALGNDEAIELLRPEVELYHYAANLAAARILVNELPPPTWTRSVYAGWLDALRTLNAPVRMPGGASQAGHLPWVMRTTPWRRKQLQTQLASWTELRHDTLLYLKQSYTTFALCEYPAGYVEPYPAFYARVAALARAASASLRGTDTHVGQPTSIARDLKLHTAYFDGLAARMDELRRLAEKELRSQPFTAAETAMLKATIDMRGGSGGPRYDGWYAGLIYGPEPQRWSPSVADVHTDPNQGLVLEEAVGDVNFLVAAIDNGNDRAIYVGPTYSYYELRVPAGQRMTDEEWETKLRAGDVPARPAWTDAFQGPALERSLDQPPAR